MQKENRYSRIGHKFVKAVKKINFEKATYFMPILDVLNKIKIKDGYILDFYKTDKWEYHTLPYVRKKEDERKAVGSRIFFTDDDYDEEGLLQHMEIPFTEMGIWQGYLLHILPGITPKGGHANYGATKEVYGYLEVISCLFGIQYNEAENRQEICDFIDNYWFAKFNSMLEKTSDDFDEKQQELLLNILGIDTFLPKVTINSKDTATVESLFFSDFGGLIYESSTAIRDGNTLRFQHKDQKVLVKYYCGICY